MEVSNGNTEALGNLGRIYAAAKRKAEVMKILDTLSERSQAKYVPPIAFANIYTTLGDREKAFVWLEKAYEDRSGGLFDLARGRFSSPLRSDARFQDLMRRIGLPQ